MAIRDWEQAVTAYRSLFALYPDSLEYGLLLVNAQMSAEQSKEALNMIGSLRKLPGGADDPRVDLAEAQAALLVSVPERAHLAAMAAVKKGTARGAPLLVARAYLLEGRAQWGLAHAKEALAAYTTAERTFGAAGYGAGRAQTLVMLSDLYYAQGNLPEARRTVEEALTMSQKLGDKRGEASALTGLANLIGETPGGDEESLKLYHRVLEICRSTDDKACVAANLNNIASVFQQRRDLQQARRNYEEAAALLRETGVGETASVVLANLASVLFDLGDLTGARAATEEGLANCRRTGTRGDTSWALYYLGRIESMQGQVEESRKHFEEAAHLDEQQGKSSERAAAKSALAELLLEQHHFPEAESTSREAVALAKSATSTLNMGFGSEMQVTEVLVRILLAEGRLKLQEATRLMARAKEVIPQNADPDWTMLLAVTDARLTAALGKPRPALAALTHELSRAEDYVFHRLWIRLAMAEIAGAAHLNDRRADGKALAKEARTRGFELLARRAERAGR